MKPYIVAILSVLILGPIVALGSVPCHVILVHCIWQNGFWYFVKFWHFLVTVNCFVKQLCMVAS